MSWIMTLWYGSTFHIAGPRARRIPLTQSAINAELCCYLCCQSEETIIQTVSTVSIFKCLNSNNCFRNYHVRCRRHLGYHRIKQIINPRPCQLLRELKTVSGCISIQGGIIQISFITLHTHDNICTIVPTKIVGSLHTACKLKYQ